MAKGRTSKITYSANLCTEQCYSWLCLCCHGCQLPMGSHLVNASHGFAKKQGAAAALLTQRTTGQVQPNSEIEFWNFQNSSVTGHWPKPSTKDTFQNKPRMSTPLQFETRVGIPLNLVTPSKCSSLGPRESFGGLIITRMRLQALEMKPLPLPPYC